MRASVTLFTVESYLEAARKKLRATSCLLYVRDPIWRDALRLVAMPGVTYTEPMYGFLTTKLQGEVSGSNTDDLFVSDVAQGSPLHPVAPPTESGLEHGRLSGSFAQREDVQAMARLVGRGKDGEVKSILFVNYASPQRFTDDRKRRIREVFAPCKRAATKMTALIWQLEASQCLYDIVTLLSPSYTVASLSAPTGEMREYFDGIAKTTMQVLGIDAESGLCTIHLVDSATDSLVLSGSSGRLQHGEAARVVSLHGNKGIIAWVAKHKQALVINNVRKSAFSSLYIGVTDDIVSEVAVPMVAGDELLGVLNVESTVEEKFSRESVRTIWYAANKAAIAHRLSEEARRNADLSSFTTGLLELCWSATRHEQGLRCLDDVAKLGKRHLQTDDCEIWRWDSELRKFLDPGSTYAEAERPRENGWSDYVTNHAKCPVWISTADPGATQVLYWSWIDNAWSSSAPKGIEGTAPGSLHPVVLAKGFQWNLAIPVPLQGADAALTWLRYSRRTDPPTAAEMSWARSLAAQAAVVTDCIYRQQNVVDTREVKRIGNRIQTSLFQSRILTELSRMQRPFLDGFVAYESYDRELGGDFYGVATIDDNTVGILLGDGEGHGASGALNMLPLMAMFQAVATTSTSPVHVIDRLGRTADTLGISGTALYLVFSRVQTAREEKLWLSGVSAAQPTFVRIRGARSEQFPGEVGRGGRLGPVLGEGGFRGVDQIELQRGDLFIGFTDGVTDAFADDDDAYRKIVTLGLSMIGETPQLIARAVLDEATRTAKLSGHADDMTVIVLRVL